MVHRNASLLALFILTAAVLTAQGWWDSRPYSTWSRDEVDKMLVDSPWGKEVRKAVPRITYIDPGIHGIERAYDRLLFHVGLLTSKPIRMALARRTVLQNPGKEGERDWSKYIDQEDTRNIVVIVALNAVPVNSQIALVVSQLFQHFERSDLAGKVTLSADGGKKVDLTQYDPLGENGYGYKFIFPRILPDGRELVEPGNKELKFDLVISIPKEQSEIRSISVNMKWDLRKMQYQGKLTF